MQKGGWVYIMSNRRNGTLYCGVTSDLARRAWQHREGLVEGFTKAYGLKRLVWYEHFPDIRDAIQREKTMKHWPRAWKVRLIHRMNPDWDDLYETLNQCDRVEARCAGVIAVRPAMCSDKYKGKGAEAEYSPAKKRKAKTAST